MAYTGILLRGDTFNNIYLDPPITRELALAGQWIGAGADNGAGGTNLYWLNLVQLAKLGELTDDQGSYTPGFKTSDLPVVFDGVGYIRDETDHMLVDGLYKWYYAGVKAIKSGDHTTVTFTDGATNDTVIDLSALAFSQYAPAISGATTVDITCTFTDGVRVRVYNETTGEHLGFINSSGSTLTFGSAQTIGNVLTAVAADADYNYSAKAATTI